jgi:hypothetical protein
MRHRLRFLTLALFMFVVLPQVRVPQATPPSHGEETQAECRAGLPTRSS